MTKKRKAGSADSQEFNSALKQTKNKFTVYDPSGSRVTDIKRGLMVKVAELINKRGWTQVKSAAFFGVTQSRISDLMRAHDEKFSIDMLVYWLSLLGEDVKITVGGQQISSSPGVKDPQSIEESIAYYSRAIDLNPSDFGPLTERAFVYHDAGRFDLAIADMSRCIELEPERPGPKFNRALFYFDAGKFDLSLEDCDRLIAQHPDYAFGWGLRGQVYEKLGKNDHALADYSKAIEIEPEIPGAYYRERAALYKKLGQSGKADADLLKLSKLQQKDKR
ncbi:MAG: tetratricopeptide repeat protein [Candidatus Obscuribacterales bacterium]|nr:tetratricopeptide repeat protein [Candidatus Obscuribacterales bacterium]